MKVENQDLLVSCCFEEAAKYEKSKLKEFSLPRDFSGWIWNSVKRNLFLSESFCRMVGMPKGEIATLELLVECIYPKDVEKFLEVMKGMYKGIRPKDFAFRIYSSGKSIRIINCVISTMPTEWIGTYDFIGVCYEME